MNWHTKTIEESLSDLHVDSDSGLSKTEVEARLLRDGENTLPQGKRTTWWQLLFSQFKSPLIYILVVSAIITAFLHSWIDTIIITLAVLVNAGIGFYQEHHSGNIFKELMKIVTVQARVIRDGNTFEIDSKDLVVGDIVLLYEGVKVPADIRLLSSRKLEANEALLTGESVPAGKDTEPLPKKTPLGDMKNMLFTGTVIERGEGRGVVVAVGKDTEIGKITDLTQNAEEEPTPLQERLAKLGKRITIIIAVGAAVIFIAGLLQGRGFAEMFTVAIAVAVAGIPEGLPAALAVVLAIATQKILKKKGLVKKLLAAETLGSATVICTDKTGTLTEGKMKVEKLLVPAKYKQQALKALAFANEGIVEPKDGTYIVRGESTDRAKLEAFLESGGSFDALLRSEPRTVLLPFDSKRAYLASIHGVEEGDEQNLYVTGSPEALLERSSYVLDREINDFEKDKIREEYESLAKEGYRLIAFGWKTIESDQKVTEGASNEDLENIATGLVFGGLVAIGDPIREDVRSSMKMTREAGIHPVMITGDHKLTARAIGRELGFSDKEESVMTGVEMDTLSDEELSEKIRTIDIFARVNPEHKMRIVKAWQAQGESVAMTGDGINDAPALRAADIGVAIGSGTDVTKEAADLVLLDDSFSTIIAAVRQGRIAFDNIRKVVIYMLDDSFTEVLIVLSTIVLHVPLPITAAQILWINLVEDGLPNFALAFEHGDKDIMKRKPVKRNERILDNQSTMMVFVVGLLTDFILVGVFLIFYYGGNYEIEYLRTLVFAIIGTDSLFNIFALKSHRTSVFKSAPFNNMFLNVSVAFGFAMMISAVYLPQLNSFLGTIPLQFKHTLLVLALGILELILVELVKWLFRVKRNKKEAQTASPAIA